MGLKLPKFFKSLKVQIALYYFATTLLAVTLMGTLLYYSLAEVYKAQALESTISSVEDNGRILDQYLEGLKSSAKWLANDADTIEFLMTHNAEAKRQTKARMYRLIESNPKLYAATLVSQKGELISTGKEMMTIDQVDMMNEPWYLAVMKSQGMPVLTSIRRETFTMDQSKWVISVGQEVRDTENNHLGIFLLDFSYEIIENQLQSLNLGSEGEAFVLTTDKKVVYHKNPEVFESEALQSELIAICDMPTGYDASMNKLTHHYALQNANWLLVGTASLEPLLAAKRQILESLFAFGLMLLGIVLGSGYLIATNTTRPIIELQNTMNRFSKDLSAIASEPSGCLEVEDLRVHFNQMALDIQVLLQEVQRKEKTLRESEIKLLYSQINPHFLYNTLDTIVWMAEFEDMENVIAITKALAQFFRISLSKGAEFIPLKDELEHIKMYLFIQEKRYGDKLDYAIESPSELGDYLVPKLLLQPIVENALYHGLKPKRSKGRIQIRVYEEDRGSHMVLVIEDNGVGFDVDAPLKSSGSNVGIENIKNRLALIYGADASWDINSKPDEGTVVTIRLPMGKGQ